MNECDCYISDGTYIIRCALHEAAPELLKALRAVHQEAKVWNRSQDQGRNWKSGFRGIITLAGDAIDAAG